METVGAYEAKTHLSELLEKVKKGARITITKHGIPIAVLRPFDLDKHIDVKTVIAELREFRERNRLSGISIREMIEDGRE